MLALIYVTGEYAFYGPRALDWNRLGEQVMFLLAERFLFAIGVRHWGRNGLMGAVP